MMCSHLILMSRNAEYRYSMRMLTWGGEWGELILLLWPLSWSLPCFASFLHPFCYRFFYLLKKFFCIHEHVCKICILDLLASSCWPFWLPWLPWWVWSTWSLSCIRYQTICKNNMTIDNRTVIESSILSTFCRGLQCAECRGPVTRPEEASKAGRRLGPACGRI